MKLPQLSQDKANHFVYGAVIACLVDMAFGPVLAGMTVIAIAAGKELFDYLSKKGTPDNWDFFATVLGGVITLLPAKL